MIGRRPYRSNRRTDLRGNPPSTKSSVKKYGFLGRVPDVHRHLDLPSVVRRREVYEEESGTLIPYDKHQYLPYCRENKYFSFGQCTDFCTVPELNVSSTDGEHILHFLCVS